MAIVNLSLGEKLASIVNQINILPSDEFELFLSMLDKKKYYGTRTELARRKQFVQIMTRLKELKLLIKNYPE